MYPGTLLCHGIGIVRAAHCIILRSQQATVPDGPPNLTACRSCSDLHPLRLTITGA